MCGRYRRTTQEEELARLYHIPIPKQTDLPISYNIALAKRFLPFASILRLGHARSTPSNGDSLQWGLIPHWANGGTLEAVQRIAGHDCRPDGVARSAAISV